MIKLKQVVKSTVSFSRALGFYIREIDRKKGRISWKIKGNSKKLRPEKGKINFDFFRLFEFDEKISH